MKRIIYLLVIVLFSTAYSSDTDNSTITLDFKNSDIHNVLRIFSQKYKITIETHDEVEGTVTVKCNNMQWKDALYLCLENAGYGDNYTLTNNKLKVGFQKPIIFNKLFKRQSTIHKNSVILWILASCLYYLSLLGAIIGYISFIIAGFKVKFFWGLINFFTPLQLLFLLFHWKESKKPLLVIVITFVLFFSFIFISFKFGITITGLLAPQYL